jgi:hypothetical protein
VQWIVIGVGPPLQHVPPTPSRLEDDGASFGHHDLFASAGVAGLTGLSPLHLEDTEVAEFDPAILSERVHDGVEYIMNDLAGLELCKAKLLGNHSDDVFPGHEAILLAWAQVFDHLTLRATDFRLADSSRGVCRVPRGFAR